MLPCADAISIMSPSPMPNRSAVRGLISAQVLHIAVLMGSGISCSHGKCAVDPSRNACDGNGRKGNGDWVGSPSKLAARYSGLGTRLALAPDHRPPASGLSPRAPRPEPRAPALG